jgi:hypothetical protein
VLFSNEQVANFVNKYFEPVWESVRPVPILKLDFGNGNVITRTLHGNIATYVCTADGEALDILPGIYTPTAYLEQLQQFRLLANYIDQEGKDKRAERAKQYHEKLLAALKKDVAPPKFINMADRSKAAIEGGIKAVLVDGKTTPTATAKGSGPAVDDKDDLAAWQALKEDTELNETVRRLQIHEMLAAEPLIAPEKVTKRLYKDVLHSDLDDPYLGLGKLLFEGYVFDKEEKSPR